MSIIQKQFKTFYENIKLTPSQKEDAKKKNEYKDVLNYIISVKGCSYYFNYLPLNKIGLPTN